MSRKPLTSFARCSVIFALALAGLAAASGADAQVMNLNTATNYGTIQAAVTAASPGDTLEVSDGTYVENVTINKNLELRSVNGRAVTTIDGISNVASLGAIVVTSNTSAVQIGATGRGFTILGVDNGAPGVENAAVYFQGGHSNAKILDNEIVARGDHGLLTEYGAVITGFVIDGNEFSGSTFFDPPAGNGFSQQFTLANVPRQLVVMGGGGGGGNTSSTTFTNNQVTGTAGGYNNLAEEQGNTLATLDSDGATITGNNFAGTTTRYASSLRTRGPATTVSGNAFDSAGIEHALKATGHHYLQNIGVNSGVVTAANTYNKAVNVDAPVTTIGWSIAAFAAAVPGGTTIDVLPGTYTEQVIVDAKDVTIQGAGAGVSTIASPATIANTFSTIYPIVSCTNSGDIRISGFTIDGLGNAAANNRFVGVGFWNAGGAVLDCDITRIRESPANGNQHGVGVYSFNDAGGPYALEIGGCNIDECQKNAMALSGPGMVVDVHDCSVLGSGDIAWTAENGIQVSYGAGGSVTDCTIDAYRYTPATWVASGLLTYQCGSDVVTSGNVLITNTQAPVSWYDTDGTCGGMEIPNGADFDAIFVYNSTAFRGLEHALPQPFEDAFTPSYRATPFSVVVDGGCLTGAGVATTAGIYALATTGTLNLDIENMTITNYDYGVYLDGAGVACTANDNSLAGNLTAGLDNTASLNAVDAELNWWGAADGPSGVGPGSGDAVLGTGVDFDPFRVSGISTTVCAFTPLSNTVTPNPAAGICISGPDPCVTVPVDITRTDSADMRGFSVRFVLSGELVLCSDGVDLSSIAEGTYLNAISGTSFQVVDNGGGSYTADCAILGLPCGQTAASGTLFTIDVKSAGGDGSGTITVTSILLRDCLNAPLTAAAGPAAVIPIDTAPPVAVADLAAAQVVTGNTAGSDTTGIQVTFTAPGDATVVEVWAKGFGNYPEYDDAPGSGSTPVVPGAHPPVGWQITSATTSGDIVYLDDRDFWYFVVYTKDDCDNWSAVSNMTGGNLNYHLGDVTDGATNGHGDNDVGGLDISHLGANYGITLANPDPLGYLDVGPTTDFSVNALPTTDDRVDFEDLIMFAINFGQVSAPRAAPTQPTGEAILWEPAIVMDVSREGDLTVARLTLVDNPGRVKGIHAFVSLGGLKIASAESGSLVRAQGAPVFFKTLEENGGVWVDLAALGRDIAFDGSGEIAVLTLEGNGVATLGDIVLRDRNNRSAIRQTVDPALVTGDETATVATIGLPTRVELAGARPNPFDASTSIVFRIPATAPVSLTVHDVTGRLVRTLVDRTVSAGETSVKWDGRSNDGNLAGAGIYFYTFRTTNHSETRKMLRVN